MRIADFDLLNKTPHTKYSLLKCFGTTHNTGNPVIVIENDNSNEINRQAFSSLNQVTCVFINQLDLTNTLLLDFYYPHTRSILCLHATLAVGYIYFLANPTKSQVSVLTSIQQQSIELMKEQDNIFIVLEPQVSPIIIKAQAINKLLNTDNLNIINEPVIATIGSPKLLIEVANLDILKALTPNLELISKWSHDNQINGVYAYCHLNNNNYAGRNFNHLDPKLEDAATGVAAGAITAHLKQNLNLFQGANLNNSCVINTRIINKKIFIGGAITYVL